MVQAKYEDANEMYMYKFRTKFCSLKGECPSPATCFDAHSKFLRRRVPKIIEGIGKYNYIPKCCPQWRRSKCCSSGDNCPRSHGWLEVIYHPLLFKTKLCKSHLKGGTCTKYGQYCAKAHTTSEVRSLVNIFGEDWKRHYDLSGRFETRPEDALARLNVSKKRYKRHRNRIGWAVAPKSDQTIDINLFAGHLLEKQSSMLDRSRKHLDQNLERFPSNDSDNHFAHPDMNSLELSSPYYTSFLANEGKAYSFTPSKNERKWSNIWEQESRSPGMESTSLVLSDISSPVKEDYESLSWLDTDWLMLCGNDSSASDERTQMSGVNPYGCQKSEICDRMPQNWFLSSCVEKASEVFTNRML